jgi:hypothetical protein
MGGHGKTRPMNSWELRFYRQLSHAEPDAAGFARQEAYLTAYGEAERPAALQAALRERLIDAERAYSD